MSDHASILFVCLGNICRSPLAKWIAQDLARRRGLQDRITFDSCGTGGWHTGEGADPRAAATARAKGLDPTHAARQLCTQDFGRFDLIVVMDRANRRDALAMGAPPDKLRLMRSFDPANSGAEVDVPDPYYGGDEGFEHVYRMLVTAAEGLLGEVERSLLS
jgi:protein-tyrosine phosphatase